MWLLFSPVESIQAILFFFHPDKLISISKHYNIVKQLRAAIVTNLSGALSTPSMKNNKLCCSNKEVFINHETGLELCALWKKTTFFATSGKVHATNFIRGEKERNTLLKDLGYKKNAGSCGLPRSR